MEGFFRELQKTLFRFPCFVIIAGALFFNACLFYTKAPDSVLDASTIKKANEYLAALPEDKVYEFINDYQSDIENGEWNREFLFSGDLLQERYLMQKYANEISQTREYPNYLQSIQDKAKKQEISIFQNTSEFTKRDLKAAASSFSRLNGIHLEFVNSDAFLQATEFVVTDLFVLGVLFYIVVSMIIYEKEHGLFWLLRAAKDGRGALIRAKMEASAVSTMLLTLLFWGENLGMAVFKYGTYHLSAPLQSVYGYDGCALPVTVGQYILLFFCSKMAVYTVISFVILLLGMKASNTMEIYLGIACITVCSFICNTVGIFSRFHILRYANLLFFTRVTPVYKFYFNLNFFQYPVSIILFSVCCISLLLVVLWYLNWKAFTAENFAAAIKRGWKREKSTYRRLNVSLLLHESYKLFISCHGLVLLSAFLIFTIWAYGQNNFQLSRDEIFYKNYMEYMQGNMTDEKENFLKSEQEMFAKYEALLEEKRNAYEAKSISEAEMAAISQLVSQKLEPKSAFEHLTERAEYARSHHMPMVYESGYLELFGHGYCGYTEDMKNAGLFILVLVLFIAPYCAGEYSCGMMKLISTQYAGRSRTLYAKGAVGLCTAFLIFMLVYAPQLFYIGTVYGYEGIKENIHAIPELEGIVLNCPIWAYLLVIYFLRLFISCATMFFVMAASVYRKNTAQAVSGLLFILAFPTVLHILGISSIDNYSLNAFYSVNEILNKKDVEFLLLEICICTVILSSSVIYLKHTVGKD